jgi:hypothetical protein
MHEIRDCVMPGRTMAVLYLVVVSIGGGWVSWKPPVGQLLVKLSLMPGGVAWKLSSVRATDRLKLVNHCLKIQSAWRGC